MSRLATIVALSLIAAILAVGEVKQASATPTRGLWLCVFNNTNCPPNGSMDFRRVRPLLRVLKQLQTPNSCGCAVDSDVCLRKCAYSYYASFYIVWAVSRSNEIANSTSELNRVKESAKRLYGPCLISNGSCKLIATDRESLTATVKRYKRLYGLAPVCLGCDLDVDECARRCLYFTYARGAVHFGDGEHI